MAQFRGNPLAVMILAVVNLVEPNIAWPPITAGASDHGKGNPMKTAKNIWLRHLESAFAGEIIVSLDCYSRCDLAP
jgi:hypothetical protein